ncbi:hypothetical protein KSC_052000 [Ktedonobacter sp. SOSP1-52]|nr:hypothetical protein KSC_052000 [Ktedonobacter sp. SOSP1-52]
MTIPALSTYRDKHLPRQDLSSIMTKALKTRLLLWTLKSALRGGQ